MSSRKAPQSNDRHWPFAGILVLATGLIAASWASGCDGVSESGGASNTDGVSESDDRPSPPSSEWLIPRGEVVDGGPGKDGIPSIDTPWFDVAIETEYVGEDRRVVGIRIGDVVRAYPHQILDWHEIVNDEISEVPVALTFCPLTGTGTAWHREVEGRVTEFGVSGLLFRNNLIPYDRNTGSNWSQMQLRSVSGLRVGKSATTFQVVETTWKTWKAMYPGSEVLTRNTGFSRPYQAFAYGERYPTDPSQILFPIRNRDGRLGNKERVHGVIPPGASDGSAMPRVYPIGRFGPGVNLIEDTVAGTEYVIVGSSDADLAVAFERRLDDGSRPVLSVVQDELPVILQDAEGNRWDVFGVAVTGPRRGQRFTAANSFTGYWFGWADFYPGLEIHGQ